MNIISYILIPLNLFSNIPIELIEVKIFNEAMFINNIKREYNKGANLL